MQPHLRTNVSENVEGLAFADDDLDGDVSDTSLCKPLDAAGIRVFTGIPTDGRIDLSWRIDGEESGSYYEVQRSANRADCEGIGGEMGRPGEGPACDSAM